MPFEFLIPVAVGCVLVVAALAAFFNAHRITMPLRGAAAGVFALLACFGGYGILATFEPGAGSMAWRIGYIAILACSGIASLRLLTVKPSTTTSNV